MLQRNTIGDECFENIKSALIESSLFYTANPDERADGGYEIIVDNVEIVGSKSRNSFPNN